MRRALAALSILALAFAPLAHAEQEEKSLSATQTSQTYLFPRPVKSVMVCNYGTNNAYYRLFWDNETPVAAVNATFPAQKLVGGTSTAPICRSTQTTDSAPAPYRAISVVCNTAETATITLTYE